MGAVGYQAHQQEATTTYRGHHQERRGCLGEIAQAREGYGEDGGEHDGLKQVVAEQRHERQLAQAAQYQDIASHTTDGANEQQGGGSHMAHHPAAAKPTHHEEGQGTRKDKRGCAVGHPVHARNEIDEVGIDADFGHLVREQGEQAEHKHLVVGEELADVGAMGLVLGRHLMLDLGQMNSGEHQGDDQHQDAKDGIGHYDIAAGIRIVEQKLADAERGENTAQAIERLGKVQATGGCLLGAQLGDVWIGGRLKEHQATPYHEQASQEGIETAHGSTRDKEEGTGAKQDQTKDHAPTIAVPIDEETCRDGHQEIA